MALSTEELWFTEWEFGGPPTSAKAREQFAKWSPHRFAENIKTPTLVITNELDFRVPVDQGLQLFTALRRNGTPSEMLVFADEGHWVLKAQNSKIWHEAVFGWLRQVSRELIVQPRAAVRVGAGRSPSSSASTSSGCGARAAT